MCTQWRGPTETSVQYMNLNRIDANEASCVCFKNFLITHDGQSH